MLRDYRSVDRRALRMYRYLRRGRWLTACSYLLAVRQPSKPQPSEALDGSMLRNEGNNALRRVSIEEAASIISKRSNIPRQT